MNDLNEVIIEGKLVKDPEMKWLKEADNAVCKFTVAVNKSYKDKNSNEWVKDTSYFLVETWKGVAVSCERYLKKGRGVRVVGELKQSLWKDKENGDKIRERVYIIAEHVEFQPVKKTENDPDVIKSHVQEEDNIESVDARKQLDLDASTEEIASEETA